MAASFPPETSEPFCIQLTHSARSSWPANRRTLLPSLAFHMATDLSSPQLASCLSSGEKATLVAPPGCTLENQARRRETISQTPTPPSFVPAAANLPSCDKATHVTVAFSLNVRPNSGFSLLRFHQSKPPSVPPVRTCIPSGAAAKACSVPRG